MLFVRTLLVIVVAFGFGAILGLLVQLPEAPTTPSGRMLAYLQAVKTLSWDESGWSRSIEQFFNVPIWSGSTGLAVASIGGFFKLAGWSPPWATSAPWGVPRAPAPPGQAPAPPVDPQTWRETASRGNQGQPSPAMLRSSMGLPMLLD